MMVVKTNLDTAKSMQKQEKKWPIFLEPGAITINIFPFFKRSYGTIITFIIALNTVTLLIESTTGIIRDADRPMCKDIHHNIFVNT
jgi:hypothetical protein